MKLISEQTDMRNLNRYRWHVMSVRDDARWAVTGKDGYRIRHYEVAIQTSAKNLPEGYDNTDTIYLQAHDELSAWLEAEKYLKAEYERPCK
jgi:hypothetical protein